MRLRSCSALLALFYPPDHIPRRPAKARVALDGFVHRRRLASRSRQLAAAQPGCSSLDPHATCSEARPQGLATPQLVSHFLLGARYGGMTVPVSRRGSEHELAARPSHDGCRRRRERCGLACESLRIHGCVEQLHGGTKTVAQGRLRWNRWTPCGANLLRLSACCPKLLACRTRSPMVWLA